MLRRPPTGIDPETGTRSRSSQLLLFVSLFGLFSTNFNVSVLAIVVPRLVSDFKAPPSTVSWLVVGPTLAYAVLGPTAGKLGRWWIEQVRKITHPFVVGLEYSDRPRPPPPRLHCRSIGIQCP